MDDDYNRAAGDAVSALCVAGDAELTLGAPPARMEGGGAATCGFVNLISRQFRMSGKVWGAAGGVLQAAWCPLAPFKRPAPLSEAPRELAPPSQQFAAPWSVHARCAQGPQVGV